MQSKMQMMKRLYDWVARFLGSMVKEARIGVGRWSKPMPWGLLTVLPVQFQSIMTRGHVWKGRNARRYTGYTRDCKLFGENRKVRDWFYMEAFDLGHNVDLAKGPFHPRRTIHWAGLATGRSLSPADIGQREIP